MSLPVAIVADKDARTGRSTELRMYYSSWPLTGRTCEPPAAAPGLIRTSPTSDVVAEYQRALAAGDVDAVVAVVRTGRIHPRARGWR